MKKTYKKTPRVDPPPFRVRQRPAGDWAVDRYFNGQIQRWGLYPTEGEAKASLHLANSPKATEHYDLLFPSDK